MATVVLYELQRGTRRKEVVGEGKPLKGKRKTSQGLWIPGKCSRRLVGGVVLLGEVEAEWTDLKLRGLSEDHFPKPWKTWHMSILLPPN